MFDMDCDNGVPNGEGLITEVLEDLICARVEGYDGTWN